MFKLKKKYEVDGIILKCDDIRYSPSDISTIKTAKSQKRFLTSREKFDISLLNT